MLLFKANQLVIVIVTMVLYFSSLSSEATIPTSTPSCDLYTHNGVKECYRAAKNGNAVAQWHIADDIAFIKSVYPNLLKGDEQQAIYWIGMAAKNQHEDAIRVIGNCYKQGDYEDIPLKAEDILPYYLKRFPKTRYAFDAETIAALYLNLGDHEQALKWYAIAKREGSLSYKANMARIYVQIGERDKAIALYREYIAETPKMLIYGLGGHFAENEFMNNEREAAIKELEKLGGCGELMQYCR